MRAGRPISRRLSEPRWLKDIRAKLGELAPPYRYAAERRLPEVVKEIVQQEMLWREAHRVGLNKDPIVQRQIDEMTKQILTQELFMREVRRKALPGDEEVQRYYVEHPAEFSTPEQQEERHILVPTQAEAEAILADLRSGKNFEELAKAQAQYSEVSEGERTLSFTRGQRDAETEQVAFGLKVGDVCGPLRTPQGFQLIKVMARRPATRQPLELAKPGIQARLQPQNRNSSSKSCSPASEPRSTWKSARTFCGQRCLGKRHPDSCGCQTTASEGRRNPASYSK